MTENLTDKNIKDFTLDDTIYIIPRKVDSNSYYLCQFVSFQDGVVTGRVIETPMQAEHNIGDTISASMYQCFLFGNNGQKYPTVNFFKETGTISRHR